MIVTYHYISHSQLGSLCPKKLMFCKKVHGITKYGTFQTGCSYCIIAIANHFDILQLEKGDTHFLMMGRNTKVIRYGQPYK